MQQGVLVPGGAGGLATVDTTLHGALMRLLWHALTRCGSTGGHLCVKRVAGATRS